MKRFFKNWESHLPHVLTQSSVAVLTCIGMLLVGFFAVGGLQLRGYRQQLQDSIFTQQIIQDLDTRADLAANLLTQAKKVDELKKSSQYKALQNAVEQSVEATQSMEKAKADQKIVQAVADLMSEAQTYQEKNPEQWEQMENLDEDFREVGRLMNQEYQNSEYSQKAKAFNDMLQDVPTDLLRHIWNVNPLVIVEVKS